jgi:serine/threonine protein kinase
MRYLKRQNTNTSILNGRGIIYDAVELATIESTSALLLPKGTTGNRPTAVEGMIRYNTSTQNFEAYEANPAFGTPGYMCPEYVKKKSRGLRCPYIAAYDVYSIGVVLVELILGRLIAMPSARKGTQFLDVFAMYVHDSRQWVVDGWKKLKRDADPSFNCNPDALEVVCKAAIQCMSPFPEDRLSTKDLLDKLRDAISLNNNEGVQNFESVAAVEIGSNCDVCNNYRTDIKCSDEGHALCATCIVDKLGDDGHQQP